MKPDGTPTVDELLEQIDQLQEFEKRDLIYRLKNGGVKTIFGRYNFPRYAYPD